MSDKPCWCNFDLQTLKEVNRGLVARVTYLENLVLTTQVEASSAYTKALEDAAVLAETVKRDAAGEGPMRDWIARDIRALKSSTTPKQGTEP